jgi:D-sedoheptulose 7-phosphate isomerase
MDYILDLVNRYPVLGAVKNDIQAAYTLLETSFAAGGKLLVTGNGGSAADAGHIVGELMKGFVKKRPISAELSTSLNAINKNYASTLCDKLQQGLPAIALTAQSAIGTATLNDNGAELVYAQQVLGYAKQGDVFLGISTSGNAKNIVCAAITAKALGLKTIALSGKDGGELARYADVSIIAPAHETYKIQELHLPIYHTLCLMLEEHFFIC